ncbi:MAG: hypothetical protein IJ652_01095 [Bacteroidales bacterium]|nr:hypothetical protein [Bacteroidales bacterium]
MDSPAKDFSNEVFNTLESLVRRIEVLEREVALLKGEAPADSSAEPIDLSLDDPAPVVPAQEGPAVSNIQLPSVEDITMPEIEEVPAVELPDIPETPPVEDMPPAAPRKESLPEDDDLPASLFGAAESLPKPEGRTRRRKILNDVEAGQNGKAVMDVMTDKAAWLHDMPGPEVRSLRSAIGLGDQVLFIRKLFRDDSALYQDSIDKLNAMPTLKEAVDYLSETFPEWDIASEDVYRFMMAVRRKIRQ